MSTQQNPVTIKALHWVELPGSIQLEYKHIDVYYKENIGGKTFYACKYSPAKDAYEIKPKPGDTFWLAREAAEEMTKTPEAPKFTDRVRPGQVWEGLQTGTYRTVEESFEDGRVTFRMGQGPALSSDVTEYRGTWLMENKLVKEFLNCKKPSMPDRKWWEVKPEIPRLDDANYFNQPETIELPKAKRERLDVMLDIESLSTAHNGATIQIAAIAFEIENGKSVSVTNQFITPQSCVENGLDVNADTMKWWFYQDTYVQNQVLVKAIQGDHLFTALKNVAEYLKELEGIADKVFIWGYPATSDMTWLQQAYLAAKLPYPVAYNRTRCLGTIADLYWEATGLKLSEQVKTKITHDALVDCQSQIEMVCKAYKELGYLNQKEVTK